MNRLVALTEERASNAGLVGHKAARLARAARAGLPVAPGWVVPVSASTTAIGLGRAALDEQGWAGASLAVFGARLEGSLARHLDALASSANPAIARSSTPLDGDERWAGAFPTYSGVAPPDLGAAVRGCWAGAFSADVLGRCQALGLLPGTVPMAVLIQPFLQFQAGGVAWADPDGTALVTAAAGSPGGLLGGVKTGVAARVSPNDDLLKDDLPGDVDPRAFIQAASLARALRQATGDSVLEWGWTRDGGPVLLQARTRWISPSRAMPPPPVNMPRGCARLARFVANYRGPLADELVVPWAFGMVRVPACIDVEIVDPVRSLREARSIARRLAAQAWGVSADQALEAARAAARRLRGPLPDPRPFRRTRAVDAAEAGKLLGIVEGIGKWLMTEGRITHPKDLWRLGGTQLEAAVRDGSVITPRTGPDPWEPFAFAAVAGSGRRYWGTSAAPGVGAGPAHLVGHGGPLSAQPRAVLVAAHPLPQLAPMLWSCAGIVTASNSVGAHLFDVARSLKVPAVAGVDLTGSVAGEGEAVVAVDGNAGTAAVLGPGGDSGDGELWG